MSMKSMLSHRPSAAMIVASAALVVALGGTASAAVLINGHSIKANTVTGVQVKESTLKTVPSANALTALPSKHSESGTFAGAMSDTDGYLGVGITYPRPLKKPIANSHVIDVQGGTAAHCAGLGKADPGYLCLYNRDVSDVDPVSYIYSTTGWLHKKGAPSYGVVLYWTLSTGQTAGFVGGSWTVTAP
jgi:hypothetical protein